MNNKSPKFIRIVLILSSLSLTVDAHPQESSPLTIVLDHPLHFNASDGQDVVIGPGNYQVRQPKEQQLALISEEGSEIAIDAVTVTHGELLVTPLALLIGEKDDTQHLVLLFPNGAGLDASGTTTEVRSRGGTTPVITSAALQQAAKIAAMGAVAPSRSSFPPAIKVPVELPPFCLQQQLDAKPSNWQTNLLLRKSEFQQAAVLNRVRKPQGPEPYFAPPPGMRSPWSVVKDKAWQWQDNNIGRTIARLQQNMWPWNGPSHEATNSLWTGHPEEISRWWRQQLDPFYDPSPDCVTGKTWCPRNELEKLAGEADFQANFRIRLLYLIPPQPTADVPGPFTASSGEPFPGVRQMLERSLLNFKFWLDEPPTENPEGEMTFWSENHQILFATAEFLAGQALPDKEFRDGKIERTPKKNGQYHMEKARPRVLRWLNDRLRFGFNEWNAPTYLEYDILPLLNLIDFAIDQEIQTRASMVLDLLFFDLARLTHRGSFGATAGRAYVEHKVTGWEQGVGDTVQILFGTRCSPPPVFCQQQLTPTSPCPSSDPVHWVNNDSPAAHALASSTKYQVPMVILAVGHDQQSKIISGETFDHEDRARVSIDFLEAQDYGIDMDNFEDGMFWWAKNAYFTKYTVRTSLDMIKSYNLRAQGAFKDYVLNQSDYKKFKPGDLAQKLDIWDSILQGTGNRASLEDLMDALSIVNEGMALTRANLYTYRTKDVMLSSVQNFRKGQMGPQQGSWQATFDNDVVVFSTYPANRKDEHDGPNLWTGNAVNPRIVQHQDAAIVMYAPDAISARFMLVPGFQRGTHIWFPSTQRDMRGGNSTWTPPKESYFDLAGGGHFDKVAGPEGSTHPDGDHGGAWYFGARCFEDLTCNTGRQGYIGLYSAQPCQWTRDGDWNGKEINCGNLRNVIIVQVGTKDKFQSFQKFMNTVKAARINISKGIRTPILDQTSLSDAEASYDIPNPLDGTSNRLELHYDQEFPRLDGKPYCDSDFPRYDNPYAKVAWGQRAYTIQYGGYKLCHTQDTGERSESCP